MILYTLIGWTQSTSQFQNDLINHQDNRKPYCDLPFPPNLAAWFYSLLIMIILGNQKWFHIIRWETCQLFMYPYSKLADALSSYHHLSNLVRLQILESCLPPVKKIWQHCYFIFWVFCPSLPHPLIMIFMGWKHYEERNI